jgi:hypothetical protein
MLAGCLPFDQPNMAELVSRISRAEYETPPWFSEGAVDVLRRILQPDPAKRRARACTASVV